MAPPKLFKAADVCDMVQLQPYVLRSWEKEFPGIGLQKSADSPRLYRQSDVEQGDIRPGLQQHAQAIVLELLSSLQVDAWEGGPRLAALYNWLISELVQANVKLDTNRISACRQGVEPLRDAWRQAAASLAGSPA